jgi:anthranilate synthase component 2
LKILILDNYDSFTYNLVHLVEQFDAIEVTVKRNDEIAMEEVGLYDKIILSPGPGLPKDAGIMMELINAYAGKKSILGVCLGHQAIAECFGGKLINLSRPSHGVSVDTIISDSEEKLFNHLPKHFNTGRYHSWAVEAETLPSVFIITALDNNGIIMAISHKDFDVKGIQFHPESILSDYGKELMGNWLNI